MTKFKFFPSLLHSLLHPYNSVAHRRYSLQPEGSEWAILGGSCSCSALSLCTPAAEARQRLDRLVSFRLVAAHLSSSFPMFGFASLAVVGSQQSKHVSAWPWPTT